MFESSKVKAASMDALAEGGALSRHSTGKALGTVPADAGYGKILALQKQWSVSNYHVCSLFLCVFLQSAFQIYIVYLTVPTC